MGTDQDGSWTLSWNELMPMATPVGKGEKHEHVWEDVMVERWENGLGGHRVVCLACGLWQT